MEAGGQKIEASSLTALQFVQSIRVIGPTGGSRADSFELPKIKNSSINKSQEAAVTTHILLQNKLYITYDDK